MIILSISLNDLWPWGENKGIPSIYFPQKGLVDRGHEVYFLCPLRNQYRLRPLREQIQGINIVRFRMPFDTSNFSAYHFPLNKALSRLKRIIIFNLEWLFFQIYGLIWGIKLALRINPQLIYVHGLTPSLPGWIISRIFRAKLVFRIYGTRDLYWNFKYPFYRIKEFRDYLAFKLNADYFIITKDGTRGALLAESLGVKKEKMISLRNGVDFDMYDANPDNKIRTCNKLGIDGNYKIILSLASLTPFYGVDKLIFSLPRLFRSDSQTACIVAGDGPYMERLKRFVNANKIHDKVFFLGFIDRTFVAQLLNSCDIFISLSKYSNTNNALFEAMVCAKCIVSMRDETIGRILTHKSNAILISPNEIDELPKILGQILSDATMRATLGKQARIRARQILETWPQRIDKEANLLEALIN